MHILILKVLSPKTLIQPTVVQNCPVKLLFMALWPNLREGKIRLITDRTDFPKLSVISGIKTSKGDIKPYKYRPVMMHAENATLKFEENGNVII